MNFIIWLAVGGVIGWFASMLMQTNEPLQAWHRALKPIRVRDVTRLGRQARCIQPELGAGQARGARRLESHQPVELTARMKQRATDSVPRPSLALLALPVEPDLDPGANQARTAQRSRRHVEVARCP